MKKILFIMGLIFLFPLTVKASTVGATISCDTNKLYIDSTFSCVVTVNPSTDNPITSFNANIDYSNVDFSLYSIAIASGWNNSSSSNLNLTMDVAEGESGLSTSLKIATIKFKVKSTTTYGTKSIKLTGEDLNSDISSTVNIVSKNNNLSNLVIEGETINFNSNTINYNLETNKSSLVIKATLADSRAHFVSGYGPRTVNLSYGSQQIQLIVVSESNENKIYTINVTRPDNRSNNNNLASLVVSSGTLNPVFNKNTLSYDVEVPNNVESITVSATLEDSKANFMNNYGPRTVNLKTGQNSISLQIEAENGNTKTYTINVTRGDESSNNYLKYIILSNGAIDFNKNIFEYKVNVLYEIDEMSISASPEDTNSTLEVIGNKKLEVGDNTFTIKVTAANKSERIYKIIVTRLKDGVKLSNNNYLKNIIVNNYDLNFDKNTQTYTLNINKEKFLSILATPEETSSIVIVTGNENLENGSKIIIKVQAEDESVKNYIININKTTSNNYLIYIIGGVILVLLVLLLVFKDKIFKKKNDDTTNVTSNNKRLIIKDKDSEVNDEKDKPSVSYKSLEDTLIVEDK